MSDITKRQAYVFLQDGDVIQEGDEYLVGVNWLKHPSIGRLYQNQCYTFVRRPIATPEQTDKLTVWDEYAKIVLQCVLSNKPPTKCDDLVSCVKQVADSMMKARVGK